MIIICVGYESGTKTQSNLEVVWAMSWGQKTIRICVSYESGTHKPLEFV